MNGREAVFGCDGAAGTVSILLYEASLLGKPAISIQPNLLNSHLTFLKHVNGVIFTSGTEREAEEDISGWISRLGYCKNTTLSPELERHENAAETVADIIEEHIRSPKRTK